MFLIQCAKKTNGNQSTEEQPIIPKNSTKIQKPTKHNDVERAIKKQLIQTYNFQRAQYQKEKKELAKQGKELAKQGKKLAKQAKKLEKQAKLLNEL